MPPLQHTVRVLKALKCPTLHREACSPYGHAKLLCSAQLQGISRALHSYELCIVDDLLLHGCVVGLQESKARCSTASYTQHETKQPQVLGSGPDISQLSPLLQQQFDHQANAHLGNMVLRPMSHHNVVWKCSQCPDNQPHSWSSRVNTRSRGAGCPFCTKGGRGVCSHNSLAANFKDIAAQWDYSQNEGSPADFRCGSEKVKVWVCSKGHRWSTAIMHRTERKQGCPDCYSERRGYKSDGSRQRHPVLADSNHPMMASYDYDRNAQAGHDPEKIRLCSHRKLHWLCNSCPKGKLHRWTAAPKDRFVKQAGCPCCSGQKVCECNCLYDLCPQVAAEWDHSKNVGSPRDFAAGSDVVKWWVTSERGSFEGRINQRVLNHNRLKNNRHGNEIPKVRGVKGNVAIV